MAQVLERLVEDCRLVVKWKITTEDYAGQAEELLLDWQTRRVEVCAPILLQAEVMSAFLRAHRRGRVSRTEAEDAIRDLLALPFVLFDVAPIVVGLRNRSSPQSTLLRLHLHRSHRAGRFGTLDW